MPEDRIAPPAPNIADAARPVARRRLVLASSSPRRREIMGMLEEPVEIVDPQYDEEPGEVEAVEALVRRLAGDKATRVARRAGGDAIVIGADTAVAVDGMILGKPADRKEAAEMLRILRDRTHHVVTGLVTVDVVSERRLTVIKSTAVTFRRYTAQEVTAYLDTGDALDKAGGYAIQHPVFRPASSIDGCYLNVVGLPLCELMSMLARLGASASVKHGVLPPMQCTQCPIRDSREAQPQ